MKVLVACEFSGVVRDAFLKRGHEAVSCDLLPTDSPGPHIQDDVLKHLHKGWDLMIAHPPCTYLCNSGVRWLYKDGKIDTERWINMGDGAFFFMRLLTADIPRICVENPTMHKYAREIVLFKETQAIQPWQFGHSETKRTCLWLKCLPKLRATKVEKDRAPMTHWASPGKDRWKFRSTTLKGIAEAMAEQWG